MKMTEHTDKVELQKEKILKESLDQQVTAIDIRFGRIQTRYASGKVVTEYPRDKRKNTTNRIPSDSNDRDTWTYLWDWLSYLANCCCNYLCCVQSATLKTYEKKPLCFSRIERTRHFVKIWRRSLQRQRNKTE
jgi:hypothetical protein